MYQSSPHKSSVRFTHILGPLQLDLEPLGADLVAVHGLDGGVGCFVGGERDESKALGEVCLLVDEDLG